MEERHIKERTEVIGAARRAKEEALVAAPAERGGFTRAEAAARPAQGGGAGGASIWVAPSTVGVQGPCR
jgi:hypothetical protein